MKEKKGTKGETFEQAFARITGLEMATKLKDETEKPDLVQEFEARLDKAIANATDEQKRTHQIQMTEDMFPAGMLEELMKTGVITTHHIKKARTIGAEEQRLLARLDTASEQIANIREMIMSAGATPKKDNESEQEDDCEKCENRSECEDNAALEAASYLQEYCNNRECTKECRFHEDDNSCKLDCPVDWLLDPTE